MTTKTKAEAAVVSKPTTLEEALGIIFSDKPDITVRVIDRMEIGQATHQGDIYIHRVADDHPRGKARGSRKLAIGQGEGSNHMAEGDGIEIFEGTKMPPTMTKLPSNLDVSVLLGPVVVAPKTWRNSHTVHSHFTLPPGTYQVTYQLDERTRSRVQD